MIKPRNYVTLGTFQFFSDMRRGVFYSFMYIYLFQLMGTVTSSAALGTLNFIGSALGQNLIWGRLSDRYQERKKFIILGELLAALGYLLVWYFHRFSILNLSNKELAGLIIIGGLSMLEFFWSMSDVGLASFITLVTSPEERGGVIGMLGFISAGSFGVGVLISGYFYQGGEGFLRGTIFFIVSGALLFEAIVVTIGAMEPKQTELAESNIENQIEVTEIRSPSIEVERTFKLFLISLAIVILGATSLRQVFLIFIQLDTGLMATDAEVSFILVAWNIGGMVASYASGKLSDKLGRMKVLIAGLLLEAISIISFSLVPSISLMILANGLNGAGFAIITTVSFALSGDIIPPEKRGLLFGRYNSVLALGWGFGGFLIGGPVADFQTEILGISQIIAYANVFLLVSFLVFLGMIAFILMRNMLQTVSSQPKSVGETTTPQ